MNIRILKVGDKVKIAKDLKYGKYLDLTDEMFEYAGQVATITRACGKYNPINFKIDLDNGRFYWYPDAMELVE